MSPLQLSVYWRLGLIFILCPFLFFLDIFTAAIVSANCHHDNITSVDTLDGTMPPNVESNQSQLSDSEADWRVDSQNGDVSDGHSNFSKV